MRKEVLGAAVLGALVLVGCLQPSLPAGPMGNRIEGEVGVPVELRAGQVAVFRGAGLEVGFAGIEGDSRCPSGVTCVWEGQVTVGVEVAREGREPGTESLTLRSGEEGLAETALDGYALRLLSVDPYPEAGREIDPSEYAATFLVSRRGASPGGP